MSSEVVLFYVLTAIVLLAGLLVVASRNLVHAAFWLMPCFLGIACLFLLLGSELLFAVQLLIYAGAVPILVLFVLMLTREVMSKERKERGLLWPLGIIVALAFLVVALPLLRTVPEGEPATTVPTELTKEIGAGFVTDYVLPFEVASVVLVGALVGAVYLARSGRRSAEEDKDA
jgi:NADH:ubiquinone oxidoreductase subunit 6 (subunit J)